MPRLGPGRARTRPLRVLADKACASKANRALLARRGIAATIPVKADQAAHRRRRGSHGGREYAFDAEICKQRHAVECGINSSNATALWPPDTTNPPYTTKPPCASPQSTTGYEHHTLHTA